MYNAEGTKAVGNGIMGKQGLLKLPAQGEKKRRDKRGVVVVVSEKTEP